MVFIILINKFSTYFPLLVWKLVMIRGRKNYMGTKMGGVANYWVSQVSMTPYGFAWIPGEWVIIPLQSRHIRLWLTPRCPYNAGFFDFTLIISFGITILGHTIKTAYWNYSCALSIAWQNINISAIGTIVATAIPPWGFQPCFISSPTFLISSSRLCSLTTVYSTAPPQIWSSLVGNSSHQSTSNQHESNLDVYSRFR